MSIPVVDIFAGPGGLGEGFSSLYANYSSKEKAFQIAVSAEMERNAARTLRLRAFFRQFEKGHAPDSYYEYLAGKREAPWTSATEPEWKKAGEEALQLQLGVPSHDDILDQRVKKIVRKDHPWVLIGGPPCQAYSLVGRARNKGVDGYKAEADSRHFLYKHYLHIIQRHGPAAFVMENVKGILSSRVNGELMFPKILEDLSRPGGRHGPRYNLVPFLIDEQDQLERTSANFVLKAEEFGVPQARHRVILLGVAEGISLDTAKSLKPLRRRYSVDEVIGGLPARRSGLTDRDFDHWPNIAKQILESTARCAKKTHPEIEAKLLRLASRIGTRSSDPGMGGRWAKITRRSNNIPPHLKTWLLDKRLTGILNHEVRSHMTSDLMRYAYASVFASIYGHSPRGSTEFPSSLSPSHKNWDSGKFIDRFKVQLASQPSSTVTSHLSKDGHYFIHPDPLQFRSLSVREAARLQTFPDNYFFEGSKLSQFKQVGNAVPPWLARQVASTVYTIVS